MVLAAVILGTLEFFWRSSGFEPSALDAPDLWARHRLDVQRAGSDSVTLVGSSRFQLGINPDLLSEAMGDRPVQQLAINGGSTFPIIESLANDKKVVGTVVVEFIPTRFFTHHAEARRQARSFLFSWENRPRVLSVEVGLRAPVQGGLALVRSELSVRAVLRSLVNDRQLPRPRYLTFLPNRHIQADYSDVDATALDRAWAADCRSQKGLGVVALETRMSTLAEHVRAIEERGGHVIFFRINSCARTRTAEEERFPRSSHYALFKERVGSDWVHFEDDLVLKNIPCGDGSHIDQVSVPRMSARLGEILRTLGSSGD